MVKTSFTLVLLWLSFFPIKALAETTPVPYRMAEKKFIPVNMVADICLLPGEKTLLYAGRIIPRA